MSVIDLLPSDTTERGSAQAAGHGARRKIGEAIASVSGRKHKPNDQRRRIDYVWPIWEIWLRIYDGETTDPSAAMPLSNLGMINPDHQR